MVNAYQNAIIAVINHKLPKKVVMPLAAGIGKAGFFVPHDSPVPIGAPAPTIVTSNRMAFVHVEMVLSKRAMKAERRFASKKYDLFIRKVCRNQSEWVK
jgi:hypothetical protein